MNKKQLILLCMLAAGEAYKRNSGRMLRQKPVPAPDGGGWEALSMKRT